MLRYLIAAFCVLANSVCAQGVDAQGFRPNDPVWQAVGRIELAGKGFCTGTLVGPDLVLTAAHCLYDAKTGARFDAGQLEFKAGYAKGHALAQASVRKAVAHPAYDFYSKGNLLNLRHDLALLQLEHPVDVASLKVGIPDLSGAKVGVLSYGKGRAEQPRLQQACGLSAHPEGVMITTCQANLGTSGAPVLQVVRGQTQVVSVVSAMARANGDPVALATDAARMIDTLKQALDYTRVSLAKGL